MQAKFQTSESIECESIMWHGSYSPNSKWWDTEILHSWLRLGTPNWTSQSIQSTLDDYCSWRTVPHHCNNLWENHCLCGYSWRSLWSRLTMSCSCWTYLLRNYGTMLVHTQQLSFHHSSFLISALDTREDWGWISQVAAEIDWCWQHLNNHGGVGSFDL